MLGITDSMFCPCDTISNYVKFLFNVPCGKTKCLNGFPAKFLIHSPLCFNPKSVKLALYFARGCTANFTPQNMRLAANV